LRQLVFHRSWEQYELAALVVIELATVVGCATQDEELLVVHRTNIEAGELEPAAHGDEWLHVTDRATNPRYSRRGDAGEVGAISRLAFVPELLTPTPQPQYLAFARVSGTTRQ
jgi:hypothetical protein